MPASLITKRTATGHDASFSEHNDVGIDGEPNDSSGSAIPAGAVDALDEVAKREGLVLVVFFHDVFVLGSALIRIVDLLHSTVRPVAAWFIPRNRHRE